MLIYNPIIIIIIIHNCCHRHFEYKTSIFMDHHQTKCGNNLQNWLILLFGAITQMQFIKACSKKKNPSLLLLISKDLTDAACVLQSDNLFFPGHFLKKEFCMYKAVPGTSSENIHTSKLLISIKVRGETWSQRQTHASPEVFSNCCRLLPEPGAIQRVFCRHMPASLDAVPASLCPSLAVTFLLAEQGCDSG